MEIVVLDRYTLNPGDLVWTELEKLGNLRVYDRTSYNIHDEDYIVSQVGNADIVFTNKTPITDRALNRMTNVRYIGVLATGYNVVDIKAAKEKGIVVTNVPSYGTESVGQFAIALLLEMCHHVGSHSDSVFRGKWANNPDWCYWDYPLIELSGKNMGIIGYGRIGQITGKIAQAMGMKVLAYNPSKNMNLESETMRYVELNNLFANSDIIAVHCPLNESTIGIINKDNIAKMKDGVMIINNSRGPLVVEEDLAEALNNGKVAGAAVDVVNTEPIRTDNPLLKAKNCIITPHISWAPKEARQRLMDVAVNNLMGFLEGNPLNVVNK